MPRPAALLIPLLLIATAAASVVAWQEHRQLDAESPTVRKAALLSSENDGLRDALAAAQRQVSDAQNVLRRSQIERDVASIRDLPFSQPVVYDVLDRAGIRQVVAGKLSEQYTDEEIRNVSTGLSAFGLLPPDFPLKDTYINLLGEQIAAFYDQHQHKLFMFQDASLENAQNRVILAHELTHALQDQNFGLLKLPLEQKDNDDAAAAASALIEGDATLVMSQYMAKDLTWHTFADTVTYSATQSMEQIRKAPHYLREMLVFPYIKGQQFCTAVFARGGFPALSAVYADPPSSTAQILHPEKYFPETRENPIPVNFADTTFRGEKPLDENVLGEMGCRILFSRSAAADTADDTAAGWRGDRYLVFDHGNVLVWRTIWRSSEAATAAVAAFRSVCDERFKSSRLVSGGSGKQSDFWPDSPTGSGHFLTTVHLGANEVVFILATNQESSDLLQQQFAGASHG
jgi:hypothetical protein